MHCMRRFRFTLLQLLMFVALVGVLLTFGKVESSGGSWQRVTSVDFSRDGRYLALGGYCGRHVAVGDFRGVDKDLRYRVLLIDLSQPDSAPHVLEDDSALPVTQWFGCPGRSAPFSPDAKVLATGYLSDSVRLWNLETFSSTKAPIRDSVSIRTAAFSTDGKTLVAAGHDDIFFCRLDSGVVQHKSADDYRHRFGDLRAIDFSTDGKLLAVGSRGITDVIDVNTLKSIHQFSDVESSRYASAAFSPDGSTLAISGLENVHLCRAKDWTTQTIPSPIGAMILGLAFSPDSATLSVGGTGGLTLLDVATGRPIGEPLSSNVIDSVAISADGRLLVAGDEEGNATLWDLKHRKMVRMFPVIRYPGGVSMFVPIGFLGAWFAAVILLRRRRAADLLKLPAASRSQDLEPS
jgi:WD40 repeat protein